MKTFFGTSLFWILVVLAFLFVSGFGEFMHPVFSQQYLVRRVPAQVKNYFREQGFSEGRDAGIATCDTGNLLESITLVTGENTVVSSDEMALQSSDQLNISGIREDISELKQFFEESFKMMMITVNEKCSSNQMNSQGTVIDPNAQRKAEIQAQVDALQDELSHL